MFTKALTAEPLDDAELAFYQQCTERNTPPAKPVREAWCLVGRRGRKTATAAMLAVYSAVYVDWPRAPGETLRFLNTIEAAVPAGKLVHVILDNYGSHKHPKVLRWLARHPRFVFHYTPTSGSWLNAVETFFSVLTRRRLKRGSFHSVVDLQAAIHRYIAEHNADPKPFTWTKTPRQILAKLNPLNAPVH